MRVRGARAAVAPGVQRGELRAQIVAARGTAQRIARIDQRQQIGQQRALRGFGIQRRGRQPRNGAQCAHGTAARADAVRGVQCAQCAQQLARLRQRTGGGRIQPGQIAAAPGGEVQRQRGQFHLQDFRGARGLQALAFRPQPQHQTRRHAAGTAGALRGRVLRDAHGLQPREAGVGIETRHTRLAAVHHRGDAGQGQAGLGQVGGQHHTACARRGGRQRGVLLGQAELAMQRQQLQRLRVLDSLQRALRLRDLAAPCQEHQYVARRLRQRLLHGTAYLQRDRRAGRRRQVRDAHRIRAPGAGQARRVQPPRQTRVVQRCRHHQQAQIGPQRVLHLQRQRRADIAMQVALVELVEHDGADVRPLGVVQQQAGEDALGQHFDARGGSDALLEADAVAHRLTDRLTELRGHVAGRRACGDAARLQHQDAPALQPGRGEQRQWHLCGLAGAGRGFQHQARGLREAVEYARQQRRDGQVVANRHARMVATAAAPARAGRCDNARPAPIRSMHGIDRHRCQPHP